MLLIAEANKKPVRKLKAGLIKYFMQQAIVFHGIGACVALLCG